MMATRAEALVEGPLPVSGSCSGTSAMPPVRPLPGLGENLRKAFRRRPSSSSGGSTTTETSGAADGGYTFANERLARHYSIPGVQGTCSVVCAGRRRARRGLLNTAACGDVVSQSHVAGAAGKWLLENILTPPPPRRPACRLKEKGENGRPQSVRSLSDHRRNRPPPRAIRDGCPLGRTQSF